MKTCWDGGTWTYKENTIRQPGISFITMTQLPTFLTADKGTSIYQNLMRSGGLIDRTLLIVNPAPHRLNHHEKVEKIAQLRTYAEQDLRQVKWLFLYSWPFLKFSVVGCFSPPPFVKFLHLNSCYLVL